MSRFDGKVVIVTGGARGIGAAAVDRLLREGARVAVWDVAASDEENDGALRRRIDLRRRERVFEATAEVRERFGRIDVLINNAAITPGFIAAADLSPHDWKVVLEANLESTLHCTQAVIPAMKEKRSGRIVNVASVISAYGFPGQTAYAATKEAIVGLTRVWARELGPFGIAVNAVRPGYIRTRMNERNDAETEQAAIARTPLGRIGEPEEVASAYLFLASDDASFINGAVLSVDGGLIP
ncbi:MAG: 3-oxoacyl-ACP reductase FabG [Thermoanaerobaculia bacterium]